MFDSVANRIFTKKSHLLKLKCQIETFHELLPGNSVFFHIYYIGTKELEYLNQTTVFYWKSYKSTENFTFGT